MLKFLKDKKKDNKGFTLVELVIVVAILAILVGILAPQYTKYVEKSRKAADASNLENLVTAFKTAASDGNDQVKAGSYTIVIGNADTATEVIVNSGNGTAAASTQAEIENLIASYAGSDWKETKLKSSKWLTTDATGNETNTVASSISATLVVDNDGSVNVTYSPTTVKTQTNK